MKEALKGRLPENEDEIHGEKYNLQIIEVNQIRLATQPVKDLLQELSNKDLITQDQHQSCFMELNYNQLKTKPREDT